MSLVDIDAFDTIEYHGTRVPATARLYTDISFVTSEDIFVAAGSPSRNKHNCQEFGVTSMGSGRWRIDVGNAYSNTDSSKPNSLYSLFLFDTAGRKIFQIFANLQIRPLPSPTDWAAIEAYSSTNVPVVDDTTYTATEIDLMFAALQDSVIKATSLIQGTVRLDVPADVLSDPEVVGTNSPLVGFGSETLYGRMGLDAPPAVLTQPKSVGVNSNALGRPVYNIRQYPFNAPSSGDITTPLQNAIDAAATAKAGLVYIPDGNFQCDPITLDIGDSDLAIHGNGTNVHNRSDSYVRGTMVVGNDDAHILKLNQMNNVEMKGITFTNDPSNLNSCGILIEGIWDAQPTYGFDFTRCGFHGMKDGVRVESLDAGTYQVQQLAFWRCDFMLNRRAGFKCNSSNNLVNMYAPNMYFGNGARGVQAEYIGMLNVFGGEWAGANPLSPTGPVPPDPTAAPNPANADACFWLGAVSCVVNIIGVQDEGINYFIKHVTAYEDGGVIKIDGCNPQSIILCDNSYSFYHINGGSLMSYSIRDTATAAGLFFLSPGTKVKRRSVHDNAATIPPVPELFAGGSIVAVDDSSNFDTLVRRRQVPMRFIHPDAYSFYTDSFLESYGPDDIPVLTLGRRADSHKVNYSRSSVNGFLEKTHTQAGFRGDKSDGILITKAWSGGSHRYPYGGPDLTDWDPCAGDMQYRVKRWNMLMEGNFTIFSIVMNPLAWFDDEEHEIWLNDGGAFTLTLAHEYTTGTTPAGRFKILAGGGASASADLVLNVGEGCRLWKDPATDGHDRILVQKFG